MRKISTSELNAIEQAYNILLQNGHRIDMTAVYTHKTAYGEIEHKKAKITAYRANDMLRFDIKGAI